MRRFDAIHSDYKGPVEVGGAEELKSVGVWVAREFVALTL